MSLLAIDLFCGLGGWTDGLLAEGYRVVGFDLERHVYGEHQYPAQLVLQDVLTLHGSQFKAADLIVASPPCQAYSYRAMPWKRAKALPPPDNTLFDACFRIQREACEAAGRHIPMVVENVCGAQKWVGKAKWHYGSYYLWGDVPALMPIVQKRGQKVPGFRFDGTGASFQSASVAYKSQGLNWSDPSKRGQDFTRVAGRQAMEQEGRKGPGGDWFAAGRQGQDACAERFKLNAGTHDRTEGPGRPRFIKEGGRRKFASAMIAKIPFELARHVAACWKPLRPVVVA